MITTHNLSWHSCLWLQTLLAILKQTHCLHSKGRNTCRLLCCFPTGALPDQIEFSKDCKTLLVSNEGEPNSYGQADSIDPEGSVSIIKLRYCPFPRLRGPCGGQAVAGTIRTAQFTAWNTRREALIAQDIKISPQAATVAQDLEPEYTTFSADEKYAFVSLQVRFSINFNDMP